MQLPIPGIGNANPLGFLSASLVLDADRRRVKPDTNWFTIAIQFVKRNLAKYHVLERGAINRVGDQLLDEVSCNTRIAAWKTV